MKIWLVEAEHPEVPGRIARAFQSVGGAEKEALAIARTFPGCGTATLKTMARMVQKCRRRHGACHITMAEMAISP